MAEQQHKAMEPLAFGMPDASGNILDCIIPAEHARAEGSYTVPLYPEPNPELRRLHTEVEALRKDANLPPGVVIGTYWLPSSNSMDAVRVERVRQPDGSYLWAVRRQGDCLNKDGEWEWEPMPSSRDDEFLARCRFDSAHAAIDAAITKERA